MTDWRSDLEQLADLFKHLDRQDEDSASVLVIGFLYHVVLHLNAAGRLLSDEFADPFAQPDQVAGFFDLGIDPGHESLDVADHPPPSECWCNVLYHASNGDIG